MKRDQIHLLQDIFQIIAESEGPELSLERIGQVLIDRCGIDVCSVYVYHPEDENLILRATVGLSKESVGNIAMDVNEGLTGLVLETMKPVFVVDPADHPRFKYYEDSGEEIYRTFLGLPLIYHQQVLGVLVIQTISADSITDADIPVFENIASQISATVAYTGLLSSLPRPSRQEGGGRKAPAIPSAVTSNAIICGVSRFPLVWLKAMPITCLRISASTRCIARSAMIPSRIWSGWKRLLKAPANRSSTSRIRPRRSPLKSPALLKLI